MKSLFKNIKKKNLIILAAILLVVILIPLVLPLSMSVMSIIITIMLYMYYSSAWNIMGGYTGLFSQGCGLYIGLGAYITGILFKYANITPWFGILIAGIAVGFLSILLGFPTFKLQSLYYTLSTFAILLVVLNIFKTNKTIFGINTGAAEGFKLSPKVNPLNMQFDSKLPYYYIILFMLVVVIFVSYYISQTKDGFYFRAISANMDAAASLGVNVLKMKMKAQFISAFFMALGGGFYCMFMNYIDPSKLFGMDLSINILLMCVVGGANTLWGPVLGAGLLYAINRIVTMYAAKVSGLANVIFGAILIAVVLFMPGGLMNFFAEQRDKRKAKSLNKNSVEGGSSNE